MEMGTGESGATVPNASYSVTPDPASMHLATDERERTVLDVGHRTDQHSTVEVRGEERINQRADESGRDLAPVQPPRDLHLEQELVDYEIEEGDMMPDSNPSHAKTVSSGGDKPQPPKISWNEWAGADADVARRTDEKRRDPLEGMHRVSADSRTTRENAREGRGRYHRHDGSRYHRENRYPRDSTPKRSFRGSRTRSGEGPLRRRMTSMHSDIPPGMSRGHSFAPQRFLPSGIEPMHRSVRPAASRMMPPGLGVSGSLSRDTQYPTRMPMENRKFPLRDTRRRSLSPQRYVVPPRRASAERFRRPQRPSSPYQSGNLTPMEDRPRSPYGNRPPPLHNEHYTPYRATDRNGLPQERDDDGRRSNNYHTRNKEFARASPRRFIPEKQQVFQRQPVPRFNDDHYRHSGNPNRMPVAGQWTSPREQRRRPMTLERPGPRHPSSPQQQLKRYPRDVSPSRHRREMGSPLRGSDHPGRSTHLHGRGRPSNIRMDSEYQRRFEGVQHRRYDDRRREPPPSPGRSKRQRQSPMAEQRSQREAAHLRGAVKSPHENPPNTDGMIGGMLHHSETDCCWFYVDPQGNTQGPCTIAQFRSWLRTLADDPQFADEHKQFMSVEVWKEGIAKRHLMTELLEKNIP